MLCKFEKQTLSRRQLLQGARLKGKQSCQNSSLASRSHLRDCVSEISSTTLTVVGLWGLGPKCLQSSLWIEGV